ncbi:MAG: trypsin-like peptidase domain-containing protein [Gammaproteobacteria bacterium]|nr:trypsin-like peptidase domain-containing protein [Gammaproteobacteria bacterium]MBQ0839711.1 trypsin-like peptidase domain-containing protein [Gammaproteobacteria bacterium]
MRILRYFGWPTLLGLIIAAVVTALFPQFISNSPSATQNLVSQTILPRPTSNLVTSYAAAVRKAAPSVVNIYTRTRASHPLADDPVFQRFIGGSNMPQRQRMESSLGSGVIVDERGFILTNNHVVAGAEEVVALLYDGREARASIVGTDKDSDLAVLKIDLDQLTAIPRAIRDSQTRAEVGDIVLAIGNPFGIGQSVSQGIISATGRSGLSLNRYENYLQTDAAINPGNSGGALIDAYGNLVGINSATLNETSFVGIGFAIPTDMAIKVLDDIITHGRVIRGWLGVEVQQLAPPIAAQLELSPPSALIITAVPIYGPAYNSGLQPGDIITHINGQAVSDGSSEINLIADLAPGDTIELRIIRKDIWLTIKAIAGIRPES